MTQASLLNPIPTSAPHRRGVLAPVVGLVLLGVCGLVVLGFLTSSVGVVGVVVGALCALLPVAPVVATFLWIDRWEPEPPRLLLFAFLWGACFAALSALLINSTAAVLADEVLGRGSGDLVGAVAVAPVVEEAMKGVFVVGLLIFRRREFDGIVDGIVYAGLVAAGFAFTENILYIGRAFVDPDPAVQGLGVVGVLLLRGVLSPFAHPLFTAMTGIGAGIAARTTSVGLRFLAPLLGYLLAVTLHALWNGSASILGSGGFFGVYGFVMVPLFLAMVAVVLWQRRREQRTVVEQLPGFAQAGWIAPSEITLLGSLAGRRGWQTAVRKRSGRAVAKAVTEYQAAVTQLAFLRARMSRGSVGPQGRRWHDEALAELIRARAKAVGHPEALTVAVRHRGPQAWTPPPPGPPPVWTGSQPPQSYPGPQSYTGLQSYPGPPSSPGSPPSPGYRYGPPTPRGPQPARPAAPPRPAPPRPASTPPPGGGPPHRPLSPGAAPLPRPSPPPGARPPPVPPR